MAVACLLHSSYVSGMASNSGEFSWSPPHSQSGVDTMEEPDVAEVDETCDGGSEEVPTGQDSWMEDESDSMPSPSNREKLQHYRMQVAGEVTIPETWPGEEHLLEWIDTEPVEEALRPLGLLRARAALISEHTEGKANMYRRNT